MKSTMNTRSHTKSSQAHTYNRIMDCEFSPTCTRHSRQNTTILHGDCLEVLEKIPSGTVDLIFADPPYNIGKRFGNFNDCWPSISEYTKWCYRWLENCIRVLNPTGSMYIMTSTQSMPYLDIWLREKINIVSRIVWHYDSSGVQAKTLGLFMNLYFTAQRTKNTTPSMPTILLLRQEQAQFGI